MSGTAVHTERVLPDPASLEASSVAFRITEEMVASFAALTGDLSSLHVDEAAARRSAYRRRVVHGMLPVGFICLLRAFRISGVRCIPISMTGRFLAPVYAGDHLTLSADAGRIIGDGEIAFDFRITHRASGAVATEGQVTVALRREIGLAAPSSAAAPAGMLLHPIALNNVTLEQIEKGMNDRVDFRISAGTLRGFIDILALGIDEADSGALVGLGDRVHLPNLLPILVFSTSVGVSLPGAAATFLEFTARAERDIELGAAYSLEGEIVHRSRGTRIVKKQLLLRHAERRDEIALRGKVAALVNEPSRRMPAMEEMRGAATTLGLEGKIVLVTGASRGIGETIAKLFALFGARVIVNYHRGAADADRVVSEIADGGGEAFAIAADVTSPEEVRSLVQCGVARYGTIDVLVNNAVRDYRPIPFMQLTWDDVQGDIDVIARGAFLCCQQVIPLMLERGGGKIINISSVAADDPPPHQAKYVMAKSALVGLTRSLSIEFASRNIQVNMVVPNFVETDLVAHVQEGFRKKIAQDTPMGRNASPVDVAQAVVYLASSFSSFTTGQKVMVTGGGAPYA